MFDTSKIKWSAVAALIAMAAQGKGSPLKRRAASLNYQPYLREKTPYSTARVSKRLTGETAAQPIARGTVTIQRNKNHD
jgi:hypothetical protein